MSNSEPVLPLSSASKIGSYAIAPTKPNAYHNAIELSQATHRINLLNTAAWSPSFTHQKDSHGLRILEIGCGQGTCTQVLAEAVSPNGHIDAVDPAPLDYGAPFTIGQAQSHLSAGPLGQLITWHQADPLEFLSSTADAQEAENGKRWDMAILAHCIWYFKSPTALQEILSALKGRVKDVLIAEYALHAAEKDAVPHVLAALARAGFEAHRTASQENIQTTLSPVGIKKIAQVAGWKVQGEDVIIPEAELSDGQWEVGTVLGREFVDNVEREVGDERVKAFLGAARNAVIAAVGGVGGLEKVRTMDVWAARLLEQ
ncbi:putative SAM-dependent methyltransferase [Rhypophila decipiens]